QARPLELLFPIWPHVDVATARSSFRAYGLARERRHLDIISVLRHVDQALMLSILVDMIGDPGRNRTSDQQLRRQNPRWTGGSRRTLPAVCACKSMKKRIDQESVKTQADTRVLPETSPALPLSIRTANRGPTACR